MTHFSVHRDQPGDGSEPGGHCQHIAVPPDAQILEGEAPGFKETGIKHSHAVTSDGRTFS